MQISESGRIVLVDDKREDIDPLLNSLGIHGIPYIYFDGAEERLPENPLKGIRFVFLDIELQGMEGLSATMKASGVVAVLKKIISGDNGPYVIIFWTKHKEAIIPVIENCKKENILPVKWFDLEKPTDGNYDIQQIIERLEQKLKGTEAFQLYVEWENIVNEASKEFVKEFSSLVNVGNDWSKDTAALFYRLYKAYVDKNETRNKEDQFKYACHLMNRSFLDTLESLTRKELKLPEGFRLENKAIPNETIAKLNTSLFLTTSVISRHSPGNVYSHVDTALKESLIKEYFLGQPPNECELCMVIISPECDLAQNKVMKTIEAEGILHRLHRVLFGLKIPTAELNKLRPKRDSDYYIGTIWHNDKPSTLILHFATMSFHSEGKLLEAPIFSLKRDLLFDLQSRAANHVNRLGNFLIE